MLGNCSSVCSIEQRNASRIRPYRNVVNQEMLDSVGPFPLVECVPEILARAKKEVRIRYHFINPPLPLYAINPDNPDQHVTWKVTVSCQFMKFEEHTAA